MPNFEIEYKINLGSILNALLLLIGIGGGAIAFIGDQRLESEAVKALQANVKRLQAVDEQITSKVVEAQERTSNRLSTVETQNTFMLRSLNRLETAVDRIMKPVQ